MPTLDGDAKDPKRVDGSCLLLVDTFKNIYL
jgi:hypothetical protein